MDEPTDNAVARVVLACDFFLRYTALLAGSLERIGLAVTLISRDHDLEFGGNPNAVRDFVGQAAGGCVEHRVVRGRVRSPAGLVRAARLKRTVRHFDADVVHLQEATLNDPRLVWASGARRGRFALTVHDPVAHPGDDVSRPRVIGNRHLIRHAGLIFVHAEALVEELRATSSVRAPVVVVPHGVDTAEVRPLPRRPSVLFFGRMSHYKGLDVLLEAMPGVWHEVPEAGLTIAGAGPIDPHEVLEDERVEIRSGHVPDAEVPELFAAATCVALPYRQASQSGVGSDAKRFGRPMVVTSVGGLPELVTDGSGIVVRPEHPRELAEALTRVLTDRRLAEQLGSAGADSAREASSWPSVARATKNAYDEFLTGED